jgi:putative transcriptional regulator
VLPPQGSLLVANPVHNNRDHLNSVVLITESTANSVMGLVLNRWDGLDLQKLFRQNGKDWNWPTPVYRGGDVNPTALVMLHTNEWYSSNTMQVNNNLSISSDNLMLEKLDMDNTPHWYKLFIGCVGWETPEIVRELQRPKSPWLVLEKPTLKTIQSTENSQWRRSIDELSQNTFSNYL